MSKNTDQLLEIPIRTAAFEKRLAELVWENCPELAKQTAAGKIAMSLEIDNEVINKLMHQEMQAAVSVFVKERSMRIESVVQTLIKENLKDEARLQVSKHVQEALRQTHIANEVGKMIRDAVREEVAKTINSWLTGDNKQAMAALVDGRVDNYIRDRTESKVDHWLETESKLKMAKIVVDRVDAYIDRVVVKKEVERSINDAQTTEETAGS
jgi:hypothetical protein